MIASFSEAKPLLVVAGPSGAGKTTVASRLVDRLPDLQGVTKSMALIIYSYLRMNSALW